MLPEIRIKCRPEKIQIIRSFRHSEIPNRILKNPPPPPIPQESREKEISKPIRIHTPDEILNKERTYASQNITNNRLGV